jgi:hypothetical protein
LQVSAAISEHPLIIPGDSQNIMDVLDKRKKDCVSLPARATAGANLKCFYGKDFEVWEEVMTRWLYRVWWGITTAVWMTTANAKLILSML